MDRRTVLAFGLIFVILVGSQVLMEKVYGPVEGDPAAADSSRNTATGSTLPAPVSAEPVERAPVGTAAADPGTDAPPLAVTDALAPVTRGEETRVVVTTPLYRVEISTVGVRVVSWEAFEHDHWEGGPVQLVPSSIPPFGMDALLFRDETLDLGAAAFRVGVDQLDVMADGGPREVSFFLPLAGGLEVRKTLTFDPARYGIELEYALVAVDSGPAQSTLEATGRPLEFRFNWNQGIQPTERVQRMEEASMRGLAQVGDELHFKKRKDLEKTVEKATERWRGSVRFAGVQNRYFTVLGIVPQEQGEPVEGTIELSGDKELLAQSWSIAVPARRGAGGELATAHLVLYIGPQEASLLTPYAEGLDKTMDLGWKLFRPLAEVVLWGMEWMHRYIANYGVIIIIFSVLTKLLFYPLTRTSTQSMKKMQELQPKLKALQEKYKNDKDKLNQATMELYKTEKVNPLAGCLPLLVQSPVFIALYQALSHTISLRGQPFVLWMTDLSQPDAITQLPFALPFLGSDLNVLPILMSVAMYFQTKMTPTSGAGGQMAAMNTMMPLIMVFIFYNMPSGLVLYWLVNTVMQGYQTWRIHKAAPSKGAQAT